jgi:bifunctional enzyme CysN/CysC
MSNLKNNPTKQAEEFNFDAYLNKELLRFTTAGSVDDGKSTLIGRLLYDSKSIFQDQMENLEETSRLRGEEVNLALLTDGLRAEREQGITIDVAYRYFSTKKRKFIIADTPGHIQYTRNMVTGASTADLAIILIDARKGVLTQSKRHGFIASLLGIPHLLVAVNKMDLVDYSQDVYEQIVQDYTDFSSKLNIHDITFIPISALLGDNVVERVNNMSWYDGGSVLHHLETVTISADRNLVDFRFPVQYVLRPNQDFRGFAGRISSGTIKKGEEIISLPSGTGSKIKSIETFDGQLAEAYESQSVVLTLEDEIDISRGDMIVRKHNIPTLDDSFEAIICWMDDQKDLNTSTHYFLQQTTRNVKAYVDDLLYKINVDTLHREKSKTLKLNEIGRVVIQTGQPIFFDAYNLNRETGSFILVDPVSNLTVAAGMIRHEVRDTNEAFKKKKKVQQKSSNIVWEETEVNHESRLLRNGHKSKVLWFTGLSGSGKSSIAKAIEKQLFSEGKQVFMLDGDNIRHGLNGDLGFSELDRFENIRRIAHVAKLFYEAGIIVLCCFISPTKEMRDQVRQIIPADDYYEVYIKCDLEDCKKRDPKGLYKKALEGKIKNFTGIDSPYEEPKEAEIVVNTSLISIEKAKEDIISQCDFSYN